MKKIKFSTELAYVLGIMLLALGTVFMEKSDFGVSMVVAPAYLVYLKLSQTVSWFTFGMAEYVLQAIVLILMTVVMRRFKISYLFAFATAIFYGLVLDGWMALFAPVGCETIVLRVVFFVIGMLFCSLGVSLLFHTYLAPEVYELFVKELAAKTGRDIHKIKTVYDCSSCLVGVILSFAFFGFGVFEGVKLGTIFCALVNGSLIGVCTKFYEHFFYFADSLKLRPVFTK